MRILLITPTQSGIGGTAQHVQKLTRILEDAGHHVEVISSDNTPVIPVSGLKNISFMITATLKAMFKRDFDIAHAHSVPSALAMKVASGKKILTIHGLFSTVVSLERNSMLVRAASWLERRALAWSDVATAVSPNACRRYEEIATTISTHAKIFHIPNGVDISRFDGTDRRYEKQVISVGRLSPEKGTDNLVTITEHLPIDVNLLILGSGPDESKIRRLAESYKNVHYLGFQDKKNVIPLIKGSDILIQPSLFDETSSSILEAMTCGTAVVASGVGGTRDMITDGQDGILLDPGDHEGFVSAILRLLEDTDERDRITAAASERAKEYDWKTIYKKYIKLYESLL